MWKQSRRDLGYTVVVQWLSHVLLFWLHGLQHARPPCPSPSHRACSNSCPLSQWYHPTISSSVIPVCPFLQSFPASGSFPINQFVTTGGQSNGASISASELPKNILDWFPLGLTGLISLPSYKEITEKCLLFYYFPLNKLPKNIVHWFSSLIYFSWEWILLKDAKVKVFWLFLLN